MGVGSLVPIAVSVFACVASLCLLYLSVLVHCLLPGHLEVLKLLVARGADVTCKDKKGYTLLHTAAASGQIEVVKHLLRLGVEASALPTQWALLLLILTVLLTVRTCTLKHVQA